MDLGNRKIDDIDIGSIENCSIQYFKTEVTLKCEILKNEIEIRTSGVIAIGYVVNNRALREVNILGTLL